MIIENSSEKMLQFQSLSSFLKSNPTEQDCVNYFEGGRGKGNIVSPFDPTSRVYNCKNNKYQCKNTGKYFNVKTGTIFENSKISLRDGFSSLYLFSSKKGTSSCQLAKYINTTQKTAWFVLHRLRCASNIQLFKKMLKDFVELDETYIGGSNTNRHGNKKVPRCQGRSGKDKIPVLGMLERNGNLITQVVDNTQQNTIGPIIKSNIKQGSDVYTDDWYKYSNLSQSFNHQMVNHSIKEYAREKVHTNSVEGFWSHLKRTIYGNYHRISRKHTQKYLNEVSMRYNTRKYKEQERFDLILTSTVGKRLTYQRLIS